MNREQGVDALEIRAGRKEHGGTPAIGHRTASGTEDQQETKG
jgi:hypothetical protein